MMVTGSTAPQPTATMSTVNAQQNNAPAEPVKRSSDNRRVSVIRLTSIRSINNPRASFLIEKS